MTASASDTTLPAGAQPKIGVNAARQVFRAQLVEARNGLANILQGSDLALHELVQANYGLWVGLHKRATADQNWLFTRGSDACPACIGATREAIIAEATRALEQLAGLMPSTDEPARQTIQASLLRPFAQACKRLREGAFACLGAFM